MNPQGPYEPQQPTTPATPSGGVPPVANNGWQQPGQAYQAPQPQTYGVDYLNQIAPKQQKTVNRFALIAMIGGILIAALFAVVLISSSGGPNVNEQLPSLSARITTLKEVTGQQQSHLKETAISEANAALSSSLSSMSADIQAIMKDRKIKTSTSSSTAKTEKTYSTELAKTLDESYQRGTLDTIYTSQMTYELTVLKSKLNKLKRGTKSTEITTFTDDALKNIDTILKAYSSFSSN